MESGGTNTILNKGQILDNRWKVSKFLSNGMFNSVYYEVADLKRSNKLFILKVVSKINLGQDKVKPTRYIDWEIKVLKTIKLSTATNSLMLEASGETEKVIFYVTPLFGDNMKDIRLKLSKQRFSLRTALHIGIQSLKSVEELHSVGYLHRDIRPQNLVIGNDVHKIYLINLEQSRKYIDDKWNVVPPRLKVDFRGTPTFASVDALKGKEQGPVDDLWSWFFTVIDLTLGSLPISLNDAEAPKDNATLIPWMIEEKQNLLVNSTKLLGKCPSKYRKIYEHLSVLRYEEKPDYSTCMNVLNEVMRRRRLDQNIILDWEKSPKEESEKSLSLNSKKG